MKTWWECSHFQPFGMQWAVSTELPASNPRTAVDWHNGGFASQTNLKLNSPQILFAYNLFFRWPIILKFCTAVQNFKMIGRLKRAWQSHCCALCNVQNFKMILMAVGEEWDFGRFVFKWFSEGYPILQLIQELRSTMTLFDYSTSHQLCLGSMHIRNSTYFFLICTPFVCCSKQKHSPDYAYKLKDLL